MGCVRAEKQAVEGKDPKCTPQYVREKWHSSLLLFLLTPPTRMGQTECSKTSAYNIQTAENHSEERIQQSEYDESLNSRICLTHCLLSMICDKRRFTGIVV